MIAPEVVRAFARWCREREAAKDMPDPIYLSECYPFYRGDSLDGVWYMRERAPGRRVWRLEDDFTFTLRAGDPK